MQNWMRKLKWNQKQMLKNSRYVCFFIKEGNGYILVYQNQQSATNFIWRIRSSSFIDIFM